MRERDKVSGFSLDGPGGSGKGTLGIMLAKKLNWHFLDSGALYRVLALAALKTGTALDNESALESLANNLEVLFDHEIWLKGEKVTSKIRTETCGDAASKIAVFPLVRAALLGKQQAFCKAPGLVADGRDMGTVVFPSAVIKFYLEASVEERAGRRYLQLKDSRQDVTLSSLLAEIAARDIRDKERANAPLRPAEDAVIVETTGKGVGEVFDTLMKVVEDRLYS